MTKNKILELKDSQSVCIILVKCYGGKISKLELKSLIFSPFPILPTRGLNSSNPQVEWFTVNCFINLPSLTWYWSSYFTTQKNINFNKFQNHPLYNSQITILHQFFKFYFLLLFCGCMLTLVYQRGWLPPPLRIIFQPAKTLNFTIKWVQLIVGSSFPVILAQNFFLPYPGVGVG